MSYPAHPPKVALATADAQPDDAWVMLEGLRIDCGSAPIRLNGTSYYFAGHDGSGTPVIVAVNDETCPGEQASGLIHEMGGTHGAELRRRTGAPKVLVLSTWRGPADERFGVALFFLGLPLLALAWALYREHTSRTDSHQTA